MKSGSADTHTLAESAKNQSGYAKTTADTASNAYIADNRAFIGPTDAAIQPLVVGSGAKIGIAYRNTGRQPVSFGYRIEVRKYDDATQWNAFSSINDTIISKTTCMNNMIGQKGFAFPNSGFSQYNIVTDTMAAGTINPMAITQDMIDGKTVIKITGCFTYHSFGGNHHTAFCFFYKAKFTPDLSHLNYCDNGWDAD